MNFSFHPNCTERPSPILVVIIHCFVHSELRSWWHEQLQFELRFLVVCVFFRRSLELFFLCSARRNRGEVENKEKPNKKSFEFFFTQFFRFSRPSFNCTHAHLLCWRKPTEGDERPITTGCMEFESEKCRNDFWLNAMRYFALSENHLRTSESFRIFFIFSLSLFCLLFAAYSHEDWMETFSSSFIFRFYFSRFSLVPFVAFGWNHLSKWKRFISSIRMLIFVSFYAHFNWRRDLISTCSFDSSCRRWMTCLDATENRERRIWVELFACDDLHLSVHPFRLRLASPHALEQIGR